MHQITMLKIRIRSCPTNHLKYRNVIIDCHWLCPLEMYSKFVLPNWTLPGHTLEYVGQKMANSITVISVSELPNLSMCVCNMVVCGYMCNSITGRFHSLVNALIG